MSELSAVETPAVLTPEVTAPIEVTPEVKKEVLNISEIYVCTQGEGPLLGVPSVLIRTSTCNLRCRWKNEKTGTFNLCDTPFTSWNAELNNEMTTQEIYDKVLTLALNDASGKKRENPLTHVIISGGEPTLWGTKLAELSLAFILTGMHITIETNGTKYVEIQTKRKDKATKKEIDLSNSVLFSISPKLASSTPTGTPFEKQHEKERINEVVLEALLKRYPSYLKFVVASEKDLVEIKEIQKKLRLPSHRISLMPEGITRDEIAEKGAATNELAIANGYRYSPREHISLYNNKRMT